jgi:salicylate hydroxylase
MAGLTSALALAKAGFINIQVFESAADLGFVGAGIQLAPNMSRILDRLGVWKEIEREAVRCRETSIRGSSFAAHSADVESNQGKGGVTTSEYLRARC